jgi:hypothetical protein
MAHFLLSIIILMALFPKIVEAQEGTLEVIVEDRLDGTHQVKHFLKTDKGERLELPGKAKGRTGDKVRVTGQAVETLEAALPNTIGSQSTIIVLVNFADNMTEPMTVQTARDSAQITSDFFYENSFGATWLQTDVVGWITIAQSSLECDVGTTAMQADAVLAAQGIDVTPYMRQVYWFPFNACSWFAGLATIGGNPSSAWINGFWGDFAPSLLAHELGHNLGLYHSHSLDCNAGVCTSVEYGDFYDVMGLIWSTIGSGHFSAPQKEALGWLQTIDQRQRVRRLKTPLIINVTDMDSVTPVGSYEDQDLDVKAVKIQGEGADYYVERRDDIDLFLIHRVDTSQLGNGFYLLDLNPGAEFDPGLDLGETWGDGVVTITPTAPALDEGRHCRVASRWPLPKNACLNDKALIEVTQ